MADMGRQSIRSEVIQTTPEDAGDGALNVRANKILILVASDAAMFE